MDGKKFMDNRFFDMAVHDMCAPLSGIIGYSEAILDGTISGEKQRLNAVRVISDEAKRLSGLIDMTLDFSRFENFCKSEKFKIFDILDVIRKTLVNFDISFSKKNLFVKTNFKDDDHIFAFGNENAISRVIQNLVDNAVKFSFDGGTVEVSADISGKNKVNICIYNTGLGIKDEDLPDIQRIFSRGELPDKKIDGYGIGLYIVSTILKKHGSFLEIDSQENKFCKMSFSLDRTSQDKTSSDF